jgi:hypothetical protein
MLFRDRRNEVKWRRANWICMIVALDGATHLARELAFKPVLLLDHPERAAVVLKTQPAERGKDTILPFRDDSDRQTSL